MNRKSKHSGCRRGLTILLMPIVCTLFFLTVNCKEKSDSNGQGKTGASRTDTADRAVFVKRELCRACHEDQYTEWIGSHHDHAMDIVHRETVKGDFGRAVLTHQDLTFTFHRKEEKFFLRVDGPGSEFHEYEMSYVLGIFPLQRYLVQFPGGRLEIPEVAWDNRPQGRGGQRWVYLPFEAGAALTAGGDRQARFLNWNSMCGECHTTDFKKNYTVEKDAFSTSWSMSDVGCQACHGPGSKHVAWANASEEEQRAFSASGTMGLEVDLGAGDSAVQVEACARCHSSRSALREEYQYGKPFMDYYVPHILMPPWYYPDGQIHDEVYQYGSFLQSKKYARGIRCSECHDPHTARLLTYGNELCIHCHSSPPAEQFSYLKDKNYDSPLHHFHKEHSPGSQCVACHMPETTFMAVDARRDHSFQIPRPDLTVTLNVPNACNRCHADKSAQWAADKIKEVHPPRERQSGKGGHFAEVFSAGQAGAPEAVPGLLALIADRSAPPIVRATALNILSGFRGEKAVGMTALALLDEDPLVRYEAVKGVSVLMPKTDGPGAQQKKYSLLAPRLKDPVRAVRSEAARALAEVPREFHNASDSDDVKRALDEYKVQLLVYAERPESQLRLGSLYENLGQDDLAVTSYRTAISLDPGFFHARFPLADLYKRNGQNKEAEQQYRDMIGLQPEHARANHLLGLLLSKDNRLDEAVVFLGKAADYMPGSARARYDYALALRHLGRNADALREMLSAHSIDQKDPAIVQAIAIFYIQDGQWESALSFTQLLVRLAPDAERPKHMLKQIQQAIKERNKSSE